MRFCWTTITVKDMGESLAFYAGIVGLSVLRRMSPIPGTEIAFLGSGKEGETEVELIQHDDSEAPVHGKDISIGFEVSSLAVMQRLLTEAGIPIAAGPFQPSPSIRFFYVQDPNGVRIQFVEHLS